jgi:hypothetical protein
MVMVDALALSFVILVQSRLIGTLRRRKCASSQVMQIVPMAELLVEVRGVQWNLGLAKPFEGVDRNSSQ